MSHLQNVIVQCDYVILTWGITSFDGFDRCIEILRRPRIAVYVLHLRDVYDVVLFPLSAAKEDCSPHELSWCGNGVQV